MPIATAADRREWLREHAAVLGLAALVTAVSFPVLQASGRVLWILGPLAIWSLLPLLVHRLAPRNHAWWAVGVNLCTILSIFVWPDPSRLIQPTLAPEPLMLVALAYLALPPVFLGSVVSAAIWSRRQQREQRGR